MRIIHHESFIDTQSSYMLGIHIENHERLRLSGIRPRLRFSEYISIPPIDIGYRPSPETIDGKRVIILETIGHNLSYRFGERRSRPRKFNGCTLTVTGQSSRYGIGRTIHFGYDRGFRTVIVLFLI